MYKFFNMILALTISFSIFIIAVYVFLFVFGIKACIQIEDQGLKSVIEEIWEGKNESSNTERQSN